MESLSASFNTQQDEHFITWTSVTRKMGDTGVLSQII